MNKRVNESHHSNGNSHHDGVERGAFLNIQLDEIFVERQQEVQDPC